MRTNASTAMHAAIAVGNSRGCASVTTVQKGAPAVRAWKGVCEPGNGTGMAQTCQCQKRAQSRAQAQQGVQVLNDKSPKVHLRPRFVRRFTQKRKKDYYQNAFGKEIG
jgi:hypothetical protein